MLNRGVMSRDRVFARLLAALLLVVAAAAGASADPPLTSADVLKFLSAGISERTILSELDSRGFAEPLDAARESVLRGAGASETLIVALRRRAPAAAASAAEAAPAAGTAPAQTDVPISSDGARPRLTFGASARSVRIPVSVLDKRGEPVLGLTSEDFRLSEDGHRQAVTFFSGERRPLRIALALDVSPSMRDKMHEVSESLRHFIDLLEPSDQIMVLTFSARIHVEQDFTSDREQLERVFNRLEPEQGTALYDAATEAIRRVATGPAESKAVVLVTDGVDTASMRTFDEVREVARRSEVPVFSIGIDSDASSLHRMVDAMGGMGRRPPIGGRGGWPGGTGGRWPGGGGRGGWPGGGGGRGWPGGGGGSRGGPIGPEQEFDARPLQDLADDTGGRAVIVKADEPDATLKHAVESIAMTLRHRYLVGYEPEEGKRGWRKIQVDVDKPSTKVQARKGYYAES
jgi:VWFA-related protein